MANSKNALRLPEKIKLNGIEYSVELVHHLEDDECEIYGDFDHDTQRIRINVDNQTKEGQFRTMLHELCHAILFEYDVANKGYKDRVPRDEETLCEMFSRGFYQFILEYCKNENC